MPTYDFDLITIGAGSGGVRASRMAAQAGGRVAIVEESRVGGTCVIRGCVPKKLLVYGSHFADEFEDAEGYGWSLPGTPTFDWGALIERKNREIDRLNSVYIRILRDNGVQLLEGRGIIVDPHTVEVAGKRYTAESILIATGAFPKVPDIPGIESVITSNEALELPTLPQRMVIVGGGYIAVEFASIFNSLGVEVTEIIRADAVLRGFDEDLRVILMEEMQARGLRILPETTVRSIEESGGKYSLRLNGDEILETDLVMYATGRAPKTWDLGLQEAGVEIAENGAIKVDAYSHSSVPSIWAIGDATDRMNLTPVALAEGMAFVNTVFKSTPTAPNYDDIPSAVFSQPELATVGLTEQDAKARFGEVDVYVSSFRPMKYTLTDRQERSFMKLIVEPKSDRVVGCHMVGKDAAEIVQGLAIALKAGATKAQFDATIGIHPSAAEEFVTMREKRPDHGKS